MRQGGLRRGPNKPSYTYDLTTESERLFPKAYGPVLRRLLDVLAERLGPEELESALREVGRQLGGAYSADGSPKPRLAAAVTALNELGGLAELE